MGVRTMILENVLYVRLRMRDDRAMRLRDMMIAIT